MAWSYPSAIGNLARGALMKVMAHIRWSALAAILGVTVSLAQTDDRSPRLLGLPEIGAGQSNAVSAGKVKFGRMLFFDPNLSADRKISCATCHQPDKAFADGKPLAEGVDGRRGARNTPSLINAGHLRTQFWDGRRATLEEQVLDPLFNPNEHGLVDDADLLRRIQADTRYRAPIQEAFAIVAADLRLAQVSQALADFVRTVGAADSAADRYLFGGDNAALTPGQIRGLELFRGRAQCASCHVIGERDALFTDHDYHSLSVGFDALAAKLSVLARGLATADIRERDRLVIADPDVAALGRFVVTLNPKDVGKFKTPSLRNVALTAPYMHDGSVATLEAAVEREIYYRGRTMGHPLILTPSERADLVAFLSALTGSASTRK